MLCAKCERGVAMCAFDTTKCKICGKEIITSHTPGNIVCKECSEKLLMCESCGKIILEN